MFRWGISAQMFQTLSFTNINWTFLEYIFSNKRKLHDSKVLYLKLVCLPSFVEDICTKLSSDVLLKLTLQE